MRDVQRTRHAYHTQMRDVQRTRHAYHTQRMTKNSKRRLFPHGQRGVDFICTLYFDLCQV